jgi:hypothetical protein
MGWVVALFGLFVVAFSGAGMGFLLFVGTTDGDGVRDEAPVVEEHEGVEVRGNMRQAPGAFGEVHEDDDESKTPAGTDEEEGDEEEGDDEGTDEEGDDEGTEEGSAAEEEPAPAPAPRPRPRPRAVPKPDPVPTAAPAAAKGTLKVRSNRRVLVYVNGAAIGYTPQDYKVSPGDYSVSASVPGQPGTKQTKDTSIAAAGATVAVEFNF